MATQDVPGANPRNADKLDVGCWAEADGGRSLIHVIGHEAGSVVFQIYDLDQDPVLFYQDAMRKKEFKKFFSSPPTGKSDIAWTWHDKTSFPWDQVMKRLSGKAPVHADVGDQLSMATRVAERLKLKGRKLDPRDVSPMVDEERVVGTVMKRIGEALRKGQH
jgi:hypothetical protein